MGGSMMSSTLARHFDISASLARPGHRAPHPPAHRLAVRRRAPPPTAAALQPEAATQAQPSAGASSPVLRTDVSPGQKREQQLRDAAGSGDVVALERLLCQGMDVESSDEAGKTALIEACFHGHTAAAGLLLKHGASIGATDVGGWSALMWAASNGHEPVVALLLGSGADVGWANDKGWTALTAAASTGRLAVVQQLLAAGASAALPDAWGRTPASLAKTNRHPEVASLLEQAAGEQADSSASGGGTQGSPEGGSGACC